MTGVRIRGLRPRPPRPTVKPKKKVKRRRVAKKPNEHMRLKPKPKKKIRKQARPPSKNIKY
jgi:hypothetical protein